MAKKQEDKKQEEQYNWLMPEDVRAEFTSDPKKMLGKYLAERVCKTWSEDFIDEDTGEKVTIERSEVLFERGMKLTQESIQQVMFSIQSEEIKGVNVTDRGGLRQRSECVAKYLVRVTGSFGGTAYVYVAGLETPELAAQCVQDWGMVYSFSDVQGDTYTITDSQQTQLIAIYQNQGLTQKLIDGENLLNWHIGSAPKIDEVLSPRLWNVTVRTHVYDYVQGWRALKVTYLVLAYNAMNAMNVAHQWAVERMDDGHCEFVVDVTGVSLSKATDVLPLDYVRKWKERRKEHSTNK